MTRRERRKKLRLKVKAIFEITKKLLFKTDFSALVVVPKQGSKEEIKQALLVNINVLKPVIDKLFDGLLKTEFRDSHYVFKAKMMLDDFLQDGYIDDNECSQFLDSLNNVLTTINDSLVLLNSFIGNEKISKALDKLEDAIDYLLEGIEEFYRSSESNVNLQKIN